MSAPYFIWRNPAREQAGREKSMRLEKDLLRDHGRDPGDDGTGKRICGEQETKIAESGRIIAKTAAGADPAEITAPSSNPHGGVHRDRDL